MLSIIGHASQSSFCKNKINFSHQPFHFFVTFNTKWRIEMIAQNLSIFKTICLARRLIDSWSWFLAKIKWKKVTNTATPTLFIVSANSLINTCSVNCNLVTCNETYIPYFFWSTSFRKTRFRLHKWRQIPHKNYLYLWENFLVVHKGKISYFPPPFFFLLFFLALFWSLW